VIRTLVVDDDFRVASIHAAYVEKVPGFVVVGQAHSAASLLASLTSSAPDLVLLDIYLPDLNGLEVLTRLRQPRSGARDVDVIVITAASDAASVKAAMQCGAVHYLLKPFGFASYTLDAIEALLERSASELSASEVAASLGVSRATAQRYLSRLETMGRITMALRYGTAGRPEHRYRHPRSRASDTG
jgi:response regulator of citrate/malate metabolism